MTTAWLASTVVVEPEEVAAAGRNEDGEEVAKGVGVIGGVAERDDAALLGDGEVLGGAHGHTDAHRYSLSNHGTHAVSVAH